MFEFSKPPENAQQLADKLQKAKMPGEFHALTLACDVRRQWIHGRLRSIGNNPGFEGEARKAALRKGPAASRALDQEGEELTFELSFLSRLEQLIVVGQQEAEVAALRKEIPQAAKALPRQLEAITTALQAVDVAVASANATLETLGRYADAGVPFPLRDELEQEALKVRELLWTARRLNVMTPMVTAGDEKALMSAVMQWPLAFKWNSRGPGGKYGFDYSTRVRSSDPQGQIDIGAALSGAA